MLTNRLNTADQLEDTILENISANIFSRLHIYSELLQNWQFSILTHIYFNVMLNCLPV